MTQSTDGIAGPIIGSSWERNIGPWVAMVGYWQQGRYAVFHCVMYLLME